MNRILYTLPLIVILTVPSMAEFAVLPYRVNNPSAWLKADAGIDYARLLSAGALIKKRVDVHSPEQILLDMKRKGLTPESRITPDQLKSLGRSLYLDYLLVGSLSKKGNLFISESLLFSVREGRVLAMETTSAPSLLKLAEADIKTLLVLYRDKPLPGPATSGREADLLFLIDNTYAAINDRPFIDEGILALSSMMTDDFRRDTRIYIVPFADNNSREGTGLAENSSAELKKILKGIKPRGRFSGAGFINSFNYAVNTVRWRPAASKEIFIITASDLAPAKNSEKTAMTAARKGIKVHAVKTGALGPGGSKTIDALARAGGGSSSFAPYHRRVFDAAGDEINLYYEGGRAFLSWTYVSDWSRGLYETRDTAISMKPRPLFEEILDSAKETVTPWNMADLYDKYGSRKIISVKPLQGGLASMVKTLSAETRPSGASESASYGRVLLSDGKISVWTDIPDRTHLEIFTKRSSQQFYFPLAVTLRSSPAETYGFTPVPVSAEIPSDYVADSMKADLGSMMKEPQKYTTGGLFTPSVWFIQVKVAEIRGERGERDIRDTDR